MDTLKSKIRILHLIETTGPGGAETVLVQLASNLTQSFVSLAGVTGKGWLVEQLQAKQIPFLILRTGGSFDLKLLKSIISIAKKANIDIIHSHMFSMGFYAALAGFLLKIPVVVTLHGIVDITKDLKTLNRKTRLKIKFLNKLAKRIVVVSMFMKSYCESIGFSQHRLKVIYNGVDVNKFSFKSPTNFKSELGFSKNGILIGSIGNIRKTKGYHHYIHAAKLTVKHIPQVKFILVGQGDDVIEKELYKLVNKLNLESHFFFLGYREDIPQILSALDVFVIPSTSEGFSIATIEAMAMKVPVVATRSGGPSEIIEDRKSGLLVPPGNPHELSEAIIKMLNCQSAVEKYIDRAYSTVITKFPLHSMIGTYERLYWEVLTNSII
jgi:glycosyltransferase involved in cell wall biosynthesis